MAEQIVYADLNLPPETPSSRTFHPSQQPYTSQSPRWQNITLCIACIGNVILLAALVALVLQRQDEKDGSEISVTNCNTSLANFTSHLRSRLCNKTQGSSSVNSSCQVCPAYWHLHNNTCYWWESNNSLKNWNDSRDDCTARDAQLLIIQDKEVLDFITNINQDKQFAYAYWIGLSLSWPEKKWMWTTGSLIDRNIIQEPNHGEEQYCGAIRNSKVLPEACSVDFRWICQKDTVLI
nr:killer cell lectin-like receptor subfamily B member 1B allele C [Anolis sagrei ordinatus]